MYDKTDPNERGEEEEEDEGEREREGKRERGGEIILKCWSPRRRLTGDRLTRWMVRGAGPIRKEGRKGGRKEGRAKKEKSLPGLPAAVQWSSVDDRFVAASI